jgi:predicted polyphosphate/ATP-dependent NAD kinase
MSFKLGLIVNPVAGIGGAVGLKGSDGADILAKAKLLGGRCRAQERSKRALSMLATMRDNINVITPAGAMGEIVAREEGFSVTVLGEAKTETTGEDTETAARKMVELDADLILFAGGDGTARNVYNAVGSAVPALGIPAGVKMHSGVYAVSPEAAGEIVLRLIGGELVDIGEQEVRDIDEQAFRRGQVTTAHYGELLVPRSGEFLQHTKIGGRECEELAVQDIAADIVEGMEPDTLYVIGPGSTTMAIKAEMGVAGTLLGVDLVAHSKLVAGDANEEAIKRAIDEHAGPVSLIITAIGGQGHILGRGNQQLSASVIRKVGIDNIKVVATKTKLASLEGRGLIIDSDDPGLAKEFPRYLQVTTGYHDAVMYPLTNAGNAG